MYEIINNELLKVKEYKGERVVTFKDIDRVHNRPEGTAGRNFRKNREHFIEGEDFFIIELTTDEIRRQFGAGKHAGKTMILLTENGYLMLVKSLTDDLSWDVQRQLVNTYFRAKETNNSYSELLKQYNDISYNIKILEQKIDALEKKSGDIAEEAVKTLIPCFYALDDKIESVAKTIIRAVRGNVKLLAVYIDYLLK